MPPVRVIGREKIPVAQMRHVAEGRIGNIVAGDGEAIDAQQHLPGRQGGARARSDAGLRQLVASGLQLRDGGHSPASGLWAKGPSAMVDLL